MNLLFYFYSFSFVMEILGLSKSEAIILAYNDELDPV